MDTNGMTAQQEVPVLKLEMFEEIGRYLDEIQTYQKEESEAQTKANKLEVYIESAKAAIAKAEEKKAHLLKKNELLKENLQAMSERTSKALKYWMDYGFDVEQLEAGGESNTYRYIFTNLTSPERYTADLRFDPKEIKIIAQEPQVLTPEQLSDLNQRLTNNCLRDNLTDYKLAMLLIRKMLNSKSNNPQVAH